MRVVQWLLALCLFTSSFDTILTVSLGGNVRLAQVIMVAVWLAALARIVQTGRILWPRGVAALTLWIMLQALFIGISGNLKISLQLYALLIAMALPIYALVQLWGLYPRIEDLMRVYLASFCAVAAYGVFQFLLPFTTGITAPGTVQWFLHGRIPRVNAFSFEPSYFATYMILGWIMLIDLRVSGARIASSRWMKGMTYCVTAAMFLCTSRMGWVCMVLEGLSRLLPRFRRPLQRQWQGLRHGFLLLPVPGKRTLIGLVLIVGLLGGAVVAVFTVLPDPIVLLSGTGLAGTPAHSLNDRTGRAGETWEIFKTSPWIGRSLGGVPIEVGAAHGVEVRTVEDVRVYWGYPVLLDTLTASGIPGFIPFLVFLWSITFGAWRYAQARIADERAKWLRALARATIFVWIILLNDQNLLRLYLWFHFAIVVAVRYHLEFAPAPQPALATSPDAPFRITREAPAL